ncbi:PaaI family thioesterase [Gordonia sp. HY442]|uniref:PaaI family thioesterase n=1 Tax=Gordonia zhenghanii TaxID=2911516 RepID=UPI001F21E482|nr:PaaI family thioesterase [Gordonia zhenghanii]MCF8605611.1 PaaI family thioesterase [Gordonia zhenghanii]
MEFELASQVLQAQPFSELLGARLISFDADRAVLEVPVDDRLRQQYGLVHGGVLAYLADNSITFAGALGLGPSVLTSGFTIDYVSGAREGSVLRSTAELVNSSRRKATARCRIEIVDDAGETKLCAVAQGTVLATSTAA